MLKPRSLAAVALLASVALAGCGDEEEPVSSGLFDDETSESPSESPESPDETAPADGECAYVADGSQAAKEAELPPATPDFPESLTISTDRGDIEVTLNPETPCTSSNFASLAAQGYYDDTVCHRLVTSGIFVLQCGDPSATGSGGPGYSFADELTGTEAYPAGTIAMANAGPNTNGSQFFIVYQAGGLASAYTSFGTTDDAGIAVVEEIAADGNAPDGVAPAEPVTITSVE